MFPRYSPRLSVVFISRHVYGEIEQLPYLVNGVVTFENFIIKSRESSGAESGRLGAHTTQHTANRFIIDTLRATYATGRQRTIYFCHCKLSISAEIQIPNGTDWR